MRKITMLMLIAVIATAFACGKTGEKKADEKKTAKAAEKKAAEPEAEEKAEVPKAEEKAEKAENSGQPTEDSGKAEKAEDSGQPTEDSGQPTEDSGQPTEDSPQPEKVNPHSATEDQPLVATYKVPGLTEDMVKALNLTLADRTSVISTKADVDSGLFKVSYSTGCPHSMLGALQTVAADASFEGSARGDAAPAAKPGCGNCPNRGACGH